MEIKNYIKLLFLYFLLSGCSGQSSKPVEVEASEKPNIILIVADDLGYGDIGAFGQEVIQTPNLDSLASNGMKFTRFYSGNTVCAPSRCALMTGLHMGNAYVRGNDPNKKMRFGDGVPLRDDDFTLAEQFKQAGYYTAMYGKWGLGVENTTGEPQLQGWDEFFGYLNQADAHKYYFDHLWKSNRDSLWKVEIDTTKFTHDLIMDEAFAFLDKKEASRPFFLYLPVALPHAELAVPEKDLLPYLDSNGNSIFEEEPFEGNATYRPQKNPKATYAAMVTKIDNEVGKIMNKLEELGINENTLVVFTSDNGPHAEGGYKPEFFNSNGNLRGFKRDLYEGGIRVPTIAYWKGKITPQVIETPYAFWDLFPTFSDLAGISVPQNLDGICFANLLKGKKQEERKDFLYWEFHLGGNGKYSQAVLQYPWKAHRYRPDSASSTVLELFNIEDDPSESKDLGKEHKDILDNLTKLMDKASSKPEHPDFVYSKDFLSEK